MWRLRHTPEFNRGAFVAMGPVNVGSGQFHERVQTMKFQLLAGVAVVALCAASGASAQSATSGWYVAGDVGYHCPTA
jgi:hypothetical protein